jgi:hypothetical protein
MHKKITVITPYFKSIDKAFILFQGYNIDETILPNLR